MYKILSAIIVLALAGFLIFKYQVPQQSPESETVLSFASSTPASNSTPALADIGDRTITGLPAENLPNGSVLYKNPLLHFSLVHAPGFVINEYNEGNGARTITFSDASTSQEFQIYVVPYDGTTISKERFKLDEPSGVMKQPTDVTIGGVRGTMFFSTSGAIGETREVWFIRGGILYEVTTEKASDAWLAAIMSTWQFI